MTKALNNPLVGWGLLTAWGLVGMQLDIPSKMGQLPFQNVLAAGVSSMCLVIFIMTRFFIIHRKRNTYFLEPGMQISRTLYTGSTMMVASCLLNQLNLATQSIVWIHYLTQIVSSIGYVILILIWCHIYGDMDSQKIEDHTILSTAVCAFVYLIAIMLPLLVKTILWVVLPAASTWLLTRCLATNADTQPNNLVEKPLSNSCEKQGITPAHVLCGIGVFVGTAASLLPGSLLLFDHSLPQLPYIEYAQLSGVALAVCLVLYCTIYARRISLPSFFKVLYPLAVSGLFFCCQTKDTLVFVGMCLLYAAQWVLYVFIWLYATERHQKNYDSTLIYALLRLLFDLGFVASGALGPLLGSSGIPITICCFGIATVFVLTILLPLDTEIDIRHQQSANCAGRSDDHGANVFGRPERLASRYSLSPRESEILTYLLNGYSLAAIRNELYIAKGTVDTYVQRIYRKCGVHSRQELVDLADEKGR